MVMSCWYFCFLTWVVLQMRPQLHPAPSIVTMRLLGSMELWLANTFLPLLLLTWLPVGTASQMAKPVTSVQFEICLENLTVQVKWYRPECPEGENQTNIVVLRENCMNFTSSSFCTASTGICMCRVFITRPNSTDTRNSTQQAAVSYGCAGPQTDVTGNIWTGFNLLLCILLGLAVGTLLYMPVIGFLLWQCRRNRTGELVSGEVAEGNQAAPVTGTEDLTYANLNFEKKGTGPASSNVIYTEIKPSQQKQSGGDGGAASTVVDVSLNEEGK
ncbi:uncharacterized protein LOC120757722 isoform X2 [Hirundo rustica]|uniref:uncharacterized protein LOC120757722 isoform X2 n=1 Tax=Hirundo rustica TaxID=43150 RepID=UPI001A93B170|nr:uncharacterized protein LOC120757722 isoform X2 [Hirundo rustica]